MAIDVLERSDLPFPRSMPEFQRLFPDEAACAAYLERARWINGFVCPRCVGHVRRALPYLRAPWRTPLPEMPLRYEPYRRHGHGAHAPLSVWFWAAYLVTSQTPVISAVQFQRQLGLSCYETAFQLLHKLRVGMVRPDQDQIGARPGEHVEADETYLGGRTRGEGRGVHHKNIVAAAVEVRHRKPESALTTRRNIHCAARVRLAVVLDRGADALCGFGKSVVAPGARIITDDWSGYAGLTEHGYDHRAIAERGDPQIAEEFMPIIHLVFSNLKTWLRGIHHGVSPQHLQAYLNELTFRFNRRFYPFNAIRSLLGIAGDVRTQLRRALCRKVSIHYI